MDLAKSSMYIHHSCVRINSENLVAKILVENTRWLRHLVFSTRIFAISVFLLIPPHS